MKLAIQENLLPGTSFIEKVRKAEKYGFQAIELQGQDLTEKRVDEITESLSKSRIKISTICAGYRGCLLSAEKEKRVIALKDINQLLSIGSDLGAVGLIVVPIFGPPQLPDLSPWKRAEEVEKDLLRELLRKIGEKAEKTGCLCLLEPLNRYETHLINKIEEAVKIAKEVSSPGIKIMADFFHMSIEEARIDEAITKGKDFIYHIHLADSNRLLPGYGHTDFKSEFAALKDAGYGRYMALECSIPGVVEKELPKCVEYLKNCMG